jgi:UDP-N-acetylmuramate-alanine ligase
MKMMGKNVTGQDMQDGEIVKELQNLGIEIIVGHQSYNNISKRYRVGCLYYCY